jgi:hypothetical protein
VAMTSVTGLSGRAVWAAAKGAIPTSVANVTARMRCVGFVGKES